MAFLELTNVQKKFGPVAAVEAFNLQVERGEFVSFLGPSGCGKTTTLRMIAGFEMPTAGTITILNADITRVPPNKRNVGMVFQSYALFPNMSVADNIGFGLKIAKKPETEIKKRVAEMLALIHMADFGNRYPYQMSGGQQQRVALARALAFKPQVLLLDEPLSALDAKIRIALRAEIRAIQRQLGITTIYVTHDQEEALSLSDRVVVMSNGRMEQVGTPFEIYNFPKTEFVAQFVGTLNTLQARVQDVAQGLLRVDNQTIHAERGMEHVKNGDEVAIAMRPERLRVADDTPEVNTLKCVVDTITFLGSIVRIQVKTTENKFYFDTFNNPYLALPKVGDSITVTFPADAVLVLATDKK